MLLLAKKNWDLFYKRNLNKFFRDRHWTTREFGELAQFDANELINANDEMTDSQKQPTQFNLLEAGCGVGNFVWPLLKAGARFNYYACDFSPVALDIFKQNPLYDDQRCRVFQADLTEPCALRSKLNEDIHFHVISLIFVLSAIHPDKMSIALKNIAQVSF